MNYAFRRKKTISDIGCLGCDACCFCIASVFSDAAENPCFFIGSPQKIWRTASARQERKAQTVVRLDQLLDDMQKLFEPEARELGLELSILSEPDLRVEADPDSLRQVFVNLFNNAKEAMAGAGTVSITAMRSGDLIRIQFSDTGPGISEEDKEARQKILEEQNAKLDKTLSELKQLLAKREAEVRVRLEEITNLREQGEFSFDDELAQVEETKNKYAA